jgi:hypothetical protein
MFNPNLLTNKEIDEALALCESIQKQCAELKETVRAFTEEVKEATK